VDRTQAPDPESSKLVSLFTPRTDTWSEQFRFEGTHRIGLTPVGRAAVLLLDLNHLRCILIRQAEKLFDLFP